VETWGDPPRPGGYIYTDKAYTGAVYGCGALPLVLVPPLERYAGEEQGAVEAFLDRLGGLILTGGGGARRFKAEELPGLAGQQPLRYCFESLLIREAWRRGMPVLGMCRGHQMMAEVMGGTIQKQTVEGHVQEEQALTAHSVELVPGTRLARLCAAGRWEVNSFHRQVVAEVPPGFVVAARSAEGLIEAMEPREGPFWLGFQFHPELLFDEDEMARRIFRSFVQAAEEYLTKSRRPANSM
jgi:putative glutamine amidotransferase